MKISLITPSIQRESLRRCCESVDRQSYPDWEHIIQIDSNVIDYDLQHSISHPKRSIGWCLTHHNNYGNTCRRLAWKHANGDWILYLDDDNYLADDHILGDIALCLSTVPHWAIFPIMRHDQRFFHDPPGNCLVDTANMVIRREIAQWPDGPEYTKDGLFSEELKSQYPYVAFPDMRPIVIMETSNRGK